MCYIGLNQLLGSFLCLIQTLFSIAHKRNKNESQRQYFEEAKQQGIFSNKCMEYVRGEGGVKEQLLEEVKQ